MKIRKNLNVTSGELDVKIPLSWGQLNDKELHYIFTLKAQGRDNGEIKRLFFLRKAGLNPFREVKPGVWLCQSGKSACCINVGAIAVGVSKLDWMDAEPTYPVRLSEMHKCKAVSATLRCISFGDWLALENLHQGFILSKNPDAIRDMAEILYPGINTKVLAGVDIFAINFWYVGIKVYFANKYSDLFSGDGGGGAFNPEASMDAMIRALTGGDVLKEPPLLETVEVERALKELNQKAREAAEFKAKTK